MPMFGLLNLDKPKDITSRKVVDHVQRLVKPAKAGHAGTLDPLATGVLVVAVGPATRLIPYVQELPKVYRGKFSFGRTSDTDDITGNVAEVPAAKEVRRDDLENALQRFQGQISQVPPQFSAVHVEGKRAYKLARAGKSVEISPKEVTIYRIELLSFDWPAFELEIECGSGTYIRSIGRDLGEHFSCGAVMTDLIRTRIGPFDVKDAVTLAELDRERLPSAILPAAKAVAHLPAYHATEEECLSIKQGQRIAWKGDPAESKERRTAVFTPAGELAALCEFCPQSNELIPRQVFLR